jgi:hypothetical protein
MCYDFPIIGILCFTSVVLYICVMISPLLIFYVSQGCFVYLCYALPIIGILCITSVVLYLCSAFPIIGIWCLTSVVLYICIMISLWLVFYVSQALFCTSVLWFPHNWYIMFHKVVLCICVMISLLLIFYISKALFCISVLWFPYNWYFMFQTTHVKHKISIKGKS